MIEDPALAWVVFPGNVGGCLLVQPPASDGRSPEHVFAMKALAARTRDIDDLRLLASMIGIETADAGYGQ